MYIGEPDGKSAGGMLFKFNVKTGKTKILMSKSTGIDGGKGVIPDLPQRLQDERQAVLRGHGHGHQQQRISPSRRSRPPWPIKTDSRASTKSTANNDKLTKVYDSVDVDGFRSLVKGNVFTSTRAIGSSAIR